MGGGRDGRRPDLRSRLAAGLAGPFATLLAALLVVPGAAGTPAPAAAEAPACDPGTVVLFPEGGPAEGVAFAVEIADEPEEQRVGLMFRPSLPREAGMIFVYERPHPASFWMKNTMIPLDMLFIDDAGRVINIAERTTPFSERTWRSEAPVRVVLEINGGLAEELGLGPGTQAMHPAFEAAEPPYAC